MTATAASVDTRGRMAVDRKRTVRPQATSSLSQSFQRLAPAAEVPFRPEPSSRGPVPLQTLLDDALPYFESVWTGRPISVRCEDLRTPRRRDSLNIAWKSTLASARVGRLRRAYLHHQRSMALVLPYLHRVTSAFVAQTAAEPSHRGSCRLISF